MKKMEKSHASSLILKLLFAIKKHYALMVIFLWKNKNQITPVLQPKLFAEKFYWNSSGGQNPKESTHIKN